MVDPRLIVALTISGGKLVKTKTFANRRYLGDPLNALRIFSEKAVDEIVILDIDATKSSQPPQFEYLKKLARAASVPLCYGGGVKTVQQAKKIISLGFEKVAISSAAVEDLAFIGHVSDEIGAQSVVVVLDVRKRKGSESSPFEVFTHGGTKCGGGTLQSYMDPYKIVKCRHHTLYLRE